MASAFGHAALGAKGLRVLASEALWVGLPCLLLLSWQTLRPRRVPSSRQGVR